MPQNRRWTWLVMIPWQSADNWPDTRMLHVCMNLFLLKQNRTEQNTTQQKSLSGGGYLTGWQPAGSQTSARSGWSMMGTAPSGCWGTSPQISSLISVLKRTKTRNKSGGKERGGKREREDEEEENSQRVTTPFERTTFIDTMQITRWLTTDNWQIHACNFFIPTFSSLCHWASPAEASAPAAGTGCPPHSDATSVSLGQVSINHVSGG